MADRPTQSSEDEIDITPRMVEVGAEVIWSAFWDVLAYGSDNGRVVAEQVYLAMRNLERQSRVEAPHKSEPTCQDGHGTN